jgi:hypothetical protein
MSTPAAALNISPAMCTKCPVPAEPNFKVVVFASAINSRRFLAGTSARTSTTTGALASVPIGAKSFTGS